MSMNRVDLTTRYLEAVRRNGARASELLGRLPESENLNVFYHGRYLSRPLFLGHEEVQQLQSDLENLRSALVSLPSRLYGGDLAAFARAVGASEVQVSAVLRSRGRGVDVTKQTRADLYIDSTGFRLLELNMGSALGGMDNADMSRALLEHPVLAQFAEQHDLGFVDTMRAQVNNYYAETGFSRESRPTLALTDWPSSYKTLEPYMRHYAGRVQQLGLDDNPCQISDLEFRDGRVWLGGRPVDIIDR